MSNAATAVKALLRGSVEASISGKSGSYAATQAAKDADPDQHRTRLPVGHRTTPSVYALVRLPYAPNAFAVSLPRSVATQATQHAMLTSDPVRRNPKLGPWPTTSHPLMLPATPQLDDWNRQHPAHPSRGSCMAGRRRLLVVNVSL